MSTTEQAAPDVGAAEKPTKAIDHTARAWAARTRTTARAAWSTTTRLMPAT